jgi:Tfp pilus assembly protein PilX
MRSLKKNNGFALLLALIISSVVLAIGVSILHISVNQINLSATARESEIAFQSAHAGIDCLMYWRNEKSVEFIDVAGTMANPTTNCFGGAPIVTSKRSYTPSSGTGYVREYINEYQWGSPQRCTNVSTYIINAYSTTDVTVNFSADRGIGDGGLKTCDAGTVCTVLISDGYNRACNELNSTIFSVQREIVVEY